jgi:hypothetical protein
MIFFIVVINYNGVFWTNSNYYFVPQSTTPTKIDVYHVGLSIGYGDMWPVFKYLTANQKILSCCQNYISIIFYDKGTKLRIWNLNLFKVRRAKKMHSWLTVVYNYAHTKICLEQLMKTWSTDGKAEKWRSL